MFSCELFSSSSEKRKDSDGRAYRLIEEIGSVVFELFELDIYMCVHFICLFLNDYTSMYTCIICEDETPLGEIERWKCETCVLECHKKCIKKWVQSSLNEGGDGNCPYCRSPITPLQGVSTREEILALCFILCLSTDALPNPSVPSDLHPFIAPDLHSFVAPDITSLD